MEVFQFPGVSHQHASRESVQLDGSSLEQEETEPFRRERHNPAFLEGQPHSEQWSYLHSKRLVCFLLWTVNELLYESGQGCIIKRIIFPVTIYNPDLWGLL